VWVTSADFQKYSRITPDQHGSGASVDSGTMIVREVLDAQGQVAKLTIMVKGPAGYNPSVGDFWFGVTQPDGTPLVDNGTKQLGKLTQCFGCHISRASDGYLFGVSLNHRLGPPSNGDGMVTTDGGVVSPAPPAPPNTDVCGDFICGPTESCASCPTDCHCCGNGHGNMNGQTGPCD
jgi:hypothetical protein